MKHRALPSTEREVLFCVAKPVTPPSLLSQGEQCSKRQKRPAILIAGRFHCRCLLTLRFAVAGGAVARAAQVVGVLVVFFGICATGVLCAGLRCALLVTDGTVGFAVLRCLLSALFAVVILCHNVWFLVKEQKGKNNANCAKKP